MDTILEHFARTVAATVSRLSHFKVVGCAVLYKCVEMTAQLRSHPNIHDMSLGILGDYLDHKEPTVCYIALKKLTEFTNSEGTTAVLRVFRLEDKLLAGFN